MASAQTAGSIDLFAPEFRADPYPAYRTLRAHTPVLSVADGTWLLTSYAHCHSVLRDPLWSADVRNRGQHATRLGARGRGTPLEGLLGQLMVFRDPPDHTRLRGLVQKVFTPRRIEELRPRVECIVDELLSAAVRGGRMDVMAEFAFPLPVVVIAELLGVPPADRERFGGWAADLAYVFEPLLDRRRWVRAIRAGRAFRAYLLELVDQRRASPGEDVLSALVEAELEGDQLSEDELITNCALILIAGHETTMNLIGNGLLALDRHPSELSRLREDLSLAPQAVEEFLRYDSPVQLTLRTALEDRHIGGSVIERGQTVLLMLGAANRDPKRFDDPDSLILDRPDNRHLAFGGGPHYCLGNALARMEAEVAFAALLARLPSLNVDETELVYRDSVALRGVQQLHVTFRV
jgi:cytochrome P450